MQCLTKILFNSCRIFLNIAKVETDSEKNTLLAGWCATEPLSINNDVQLHFAALALYSTCKPYSLYPRLHVTLNRLLTPLSISRNKHLMLVETSVFSWPDYNSQNRNSSLPTYPPSLHCTYDITPSPTLSTVGRSIIIGRQLLPISH